MKGNQRYWAALRRGVALGLALVAAWGVSLITDFPDFGTALSDLGRNSTLAASLMASQLGPLPQEEAGLTGWGRLLLSQSALLSEGEAPVLQLRSARQEEEEELMDLQGHGDGDDDDQSEPNLQPPSGDDGVVEMTAQGKEGGQYLYGEGVYVYNRSGLELDASVIGEGQVDVPLGEGPQILIIHSHGSEAYSQYDGDVYEESDPYRTTDCTHNMVRVGEEMATVFRAYGFQVVHDTTLYDYPAYNGSYDRSLAGVQQWLEQYPTIRIVLDVHRDALVGSDGSVYKLVSEEAGEKVAQVMLVVGTNGSGLEHPRWTDNLAFAVRLQQNLVRGYDSLARPIVLRSSRYNQQLLPGYLLVEVGGHGNTLEEALAGARLWTDNVARTRLEVKGEESAG